MEMTRWGNPVAVLIRQRLLKQLITRRRSFSQAYDELAANVALGELALDPDQTNCSQEHAKRQPDAPSGYEQWSIA